MMGRKTTPLVIERFGEPISEEEAREALGGQRNTPQIRAVFAIAEDLLSSYRSESENPDITDSTRNHHCGKSAAMAEFLAILSEQIGTEV